MILSWTGRLGPGTMLGLMLPAITAAIQNDLIAVKMEHEIMEGSCAAKRVMLRGDQHVRVGRRRAARLSIVRP